jgi:hypothetical protein
MTDMPHITTHKVNALFGPIFADPEARQCLTSKQCTQVDAILQKGELTRRDLKKLSRAVDDVLDHVLPDAHEHDED